MKKFASVALTLAMLLSLCMLSSCGKVTAYSLVADAQEKMSKLDSYEMEADITMQLDMGMMGGKADIPAKIRVKAAGLMSDSPVLLETIEMAGESISVYNEGEWMYGVVDGVGVKSRVDEDFDIIMESYDNVGFMKKPFSEELMKDVEIVEDEDGTRSVSVAVPDDMLEEYFDIVLKELMGEGISENEGVDVSMGFTDTVVDFAIDENGYISHYDISGNIFVKGTMTESGGVSVSMEIPFDMTCTFVDPGTAVTVTPPEGYQDFAESGSASL